MPRPLVCLSSNIYYRSSAVAEHYLKTELYERVRESAELFEWLQAGSLDGIWYWDLENPEHEWLSSRFKQLFGYEDHEVPNTSEWWQRNIFAEDLPGVLETFDRHVKEGAPYDQVVRYRHRDGSTVWVRCRGLVMRNEAGEPVRMLGAHTDVTPLKKAEERLQETNRELEAFAYSVSHDLRAPLRAIDGFSEALLQDYGDKLDAAGEDKLRRVRAAAQRLGALIDALLSLSRLTRREMKMERVDLGALARSVYHQLREAEPGRQASFLIAEGIEVHGDSEMLRVLLENLLGNAWKFTARQPAAEIELGMAKVDGQPAYFVRDNGAGFDMAYAKKLFGPFQRLHRQDEFPGDGVGLATVERIVRRHGGRVWAEGAVNQGATFFFTL